MVGFSGREKGFRNHFAAGSDQIKDMENLKEKGLVIKGATGNGLTFYHATKLGCEMAGLNEKETARALE